MLADHIGCLAQVSRPLRWRGRAPSSECLMGSLDGSIDISGAGLRDLVYDAAVAGIEGLTVFFTEGRMPLPVVEQLLVRRRRVLDAGQLGSHG